MEQAELIPPSDDPYEALRVIVMRLGGPKKVGKMLWPEKTIEAAAIHLNNCLNRDRQEKLDLDQIDLLVAKGREIGCHAFMECMGMRHAYRVEPIEPENERARLQREFIEAAKHMETLAERITRLEPAIKAVA